MTYERENLIVGVFAIGFLLLCRLALLLCEETLLIVQDTLNVNVMDTRVLYFAVRLFGMGFHENPGWYVIGGVVVSLMVMKKAHASARVRQIALFAYCSLILLSIAFIMALA